MLTKQVISLIILFIYILGYHLYYRHKGEDWKQIQLDSDRRTFTLDKLSCGSSYEIYLQAFNAVGQGVPSQTIQASTRGERK